MLPVSALDIVTEPESAELLIPDEIRTPPPASDSPLPSINDLDPLIVLPKPEAKPNTPSIPRAD